MKGRHITEAHFL